MKSWKKRSISAALALTCVAAPMAYPMTAYAASTAEKILYGAAAMVFISSYYSKMDDHNQLQLLDQCQQEQTPPGLFHASLYEHVFPFPSRLSPCNHRQQLIDFSFGAIHPVSKYSIQLTQ